MRFHRPFSPRASFTHQRSMRRALIASIRCANGGWRHPSGSSVRHDASASALSASQPLHETRYGRVGLYAKSGQLLIAQNPLSIEACDLQDKLDRLPHCGHEIPSSERTIFNATVTSSAGSSPRAAAAAL